MIIETPNFNVIKVFTTSTHTPPTPYMKPKASHDTVDYICARTVSAQGVKGAILDSVSQFCWEDCFCFALNLNTVSKRRSKADLLGMGNIISISA